MKISNLNLTNYRNHIDQKLEFDPQTTLIIGDNGAGKTNVLEAIHLLATTKVFRPGYDHEVITHDTNFARAEANIEANGDSHLLEVMVIKNPNYENLSSKKVKLNKVAKPVQKVAGILNTVLFTPENIQIITGPPTLRRDYMDAVLFQTDARYKVAHTQYIKIMRSRNKLLETIAKTGRGWRQIEFWNKKLAENGKIIQKGRGELLKFFKDKLPGHGKVLNGDIPVDIVYKKSPINLGQVEKEILARRTLSGPHRDDLEILLDERNISNFGSRGQQRSVLLALKLCEIDFLLDKRGARPVLLLDDIFSELDEHHREAVGSIVDKQQTIITSTSRDEIPNVATAVTIQL